MAQQQNRVQEGVAQIRTAVRTVDRRFRKLQRQVSTRRRQLARVQKEITRQPLVKQAQKRAGSLRAEAQSRLEAGVASFFEAFPIATRSEIERIDRKLRSIDRKLRELEKSQGASSEAA